MEGEKKYLMKMKCKGQKWKNRVRESHQNKWEVKNAVRLKLKKNKKKKAILTENFQIKLKT